MNWELIALLLNDFWECEAKDLYLQTKHYERDIYNFWETKPVPNTERGNHHG
jgi:hypothetical protein